VERYYQTLDDIKKSLSPIKTSWKDELSEAVIKLVKTIPDQQSYNIDTLRYLLDSNFKAGLIIIRLILELSKDEFEIMLRDEISHGSIGKRLYQQDPEKFLNALNKLGALEAFQNLVKKPISWKTILVERLKAGRGSAIKGQARGRFLEGLVEDILKKIFGKKGYHPRCRFYGARGTSTEKIDFAIPSKKDPHILIEVKAYGATGSKQTDILGDITRIIQEKRHDTHLLLVTDGISWKVRLSDLSKLIEMQNQGLITRIYTSSMASELEKDLKQLKQEHGL